MEGYVVRMGSALLIAALLFLCGELLKKMGLRRHLIPAVLGLAGSLMGIALALVQPVDTLGALLPGAAEGFMGAALSVYLHQLGCQFARRDKAQIPFKGFYFNKKGEGL
jgi:hypothetical protein